MFSPGADGQQTGLTWKQMLDFVRKVDQSENQS